MNYLQVYLLFIGLAHFSLNLKGSNPDIPLYTISEFKESHPHTLCGKSISLNKEFEFEIKFNNRNYEGISLFTLEAGNFNKTVVDMINSDPKGEPHYSQEYHTRSQLPIDQKFYFQVKGAGSTTLNFQYKTKDKAGSETSKDCKIKVNVAKAKSLKEGL